MLFSGKLSFETRMAIVAVILAISFILVLLGFDKVVSEALLGFGVVGAALGGLFYTFGITTPFSMVVILDLMRLEDPAIVAFFACASAATVDCLFFSVVRDALEANTKKLMERLRKKSRRISSLFPVAGFFVFGLPLPDELGLALMEISEIRLAKLWIIVFLSKFITLMMLWKATSP